MAKVYYKNYSKENSSRTKCTLYFKEKKEPQDVSEEVKDYIIAKAPEGTLILDDETVDHNMRFIGANPSNYIDIGDRDADGNVILWRIIGAMNNIKSNEEDEVGETRLKIIRNESIGNYSWDTTRTVNYKSGINEWSQADLMKLLNPEYEENTDTDINGTIIDVNNSLYWNSASGNCYTASQNTHSLCDFTNIGLSDEAKRYIDKVLWNIGTNGANDYTSLEFGLTDNFYEYERSSNTGKICTSGGENMERKICLKNKLYNNGFGYSCWSKDWIINSGNLWTLTPYASSSAASSAFYVSTSSTTSRESYISTWSCSGAKAIFPTGYLKATINITAGDETMDNPFQFSLN